MLIFILNSCNTNEDHTQPKDPIISEPVVNSDSIIKAELNQKYDIYPNIIYHQVYIENSSQLSKLKQKYKASVNNPYPNRVFLTLNRKEMRFMRVKDTLIVPDTIINDTRAYSVFPQYYHESRNIPKILLVSNKYQCYAAYEYGVQVKFAAVNSGKEKTQTYPGRYALTWKDRLRRSSLDSNWVLPFTWNFHKYAGNAFHQFAMPGYPASHSCIRQFMNDAKWLFEWGKGAKNDSNVTQIWLSGTPVIIIDAFDFSRPKTGPWVALKSNQFKIDYLPEDPMEVEEALIPISQIPEDTRGWLPKVERYKYAEDTLRARGIIQENIRITPSVNFNKIRRLKAKKKVAEEAKKKLLEVQDNSQPEIENNSLPPDSLKSSRSVSN